MKHLFGSIPYKVSEKFYKKIYPYSMKFLCKRPKGMRKIQSSYRDEIETYAREICARFKGKISFRYAGPTYATSLSGFFIYFEKLEDAIAITKKRDMKPHIVYVSGPLSEDAQTIMSEDAHTVIRARFFWDKYRYRVTYDSNLSEKLFYEIADNVESISKTVSATAGYPSRIYATTEDDIVMVLLASGNHIDYYEKTILYTEVENHELITNP